MTNSRTKSDFVINDTIKKKVDWLENESEKKQKISEKYFQIRAEKAFLENNFYSKSTACNSGSEPENEKNLIFPEKNIQVFRLKFTKTIGY